MINRIKNTAGKIMLLWGWQRHAASIACGVLSAFAMAPYHFFPVLFITFPVFVWLLDGAATDPANNAWQRMKSFFKTGWMFGFGFHLSGMWWVGNAFLVDAEEFLWLLPIAVIALPALLAMFIGLACAVARPFWHESWKRIFLFALVMAVFEYLRGVVFTGLPWNLIGYAAMSIPLTMQSASVVGVYGVTLLFVPVFACLACLTNAERSARGIWLVLLYAISITGAHIGYGFNRLSAAHTDTVEGVSLRIVQPNINQKDKWDPTKESQIFNRFLSLSTATENGAALSDATHLIWPESSFPFILTDRRDALAAIAAMLPDGTSLITGAARLEAPVVADGPSFVFNSVYVIDSEGIVIDAADKVHLVPFGEYLPFQSTLESMGLEQLTQVRGGFVAGNSRKTLKTETGPSFLPLICYEIIFSGNIVRGTKGAQWIVNLTNDAWFGNTPGPFQHFHQSIVRGVEEGLPVVRAANSGISAVVDAYGRVIERLDVHQAGHIDSKLPKAAEPTIFSSFGNLPFILLCGLFAFLSASRRNI